jgi:hypothetical protein
MISWKASGAQPRNAIDFERAAMTGTSPRKARNDGTSSLGDLLAHGALEHCAAERPTVRTGLPAGGNRIRTIGPAEGARHHLGVGSRSPTFPWRGPPRGSRFGRMIPEPHTIGAGRLSCCLSPGIGNGKHGPQPGPPLPPQGGASGLDAYLGSRRECESDQPERDGHVCYDFVVHCRDGGRVRRGWRPTGKRGRSS